MSHFMDHIVTLKMTYNTTDTTQLRKLKQVIRCVNIKTYCFVQYVQKML